MKDMQNTFAMKLINIILVLLAAGFVTIQFIPKGLPENSAESDNDIAATGEIPEKVATILKTSCYDCHSNQTKYPWYARIAPASWLLAKDIKEGRHKLNYSEWKGYPKRSVIGKLESIRDDVEQKDMPLPAYTLIHRKAKLTDEQVALIVKWTEDMTDKIMQ
jgi:hypothetical protein